MFKKLLFLIIAFTLAIVAVFVRHIFENDFPYKVSVDVSETSYNLALPKVNEGVMDCIVELNIPDTQIHGYIYYKLYGSNGTWRKVKLLRLNNKLVCILPYQKPMVKLMYYLELEDSKGKIYPVAKDQPFVVLFRAQVPRLLSYVITLLFFISLVISSYAGLVTGFNIPYFLKYVRLIFYLLLAAIVLDFIAYLYAYRHLLVEPSPYNDLRFFIHLLIFSLWAFTFYLQRKGSEKRYVVFVASLLTIFLYCAPDHFIFKPLF